MTTAGAIAARLDRRPARRLHRLVAANARRLAGLRRLPWRVRHRLEKVAGTDPGRVACFGAAPAGPRHALLVTYDLSLSGAPKLVHQIATRMIGDGWGVTVLSAEDGHFRAPLVAAGAAVVIAPTLTANDSRLLAALGAALAVDVLVANTIESFPAVLALGARVPTLWYIHEVSLLRHRLDTDPAVARALRLATTLWAGSALPAAILREVRDDVAVVPYGLDPLGDAAPPGGGGTAPLRVGIFGSYEPRKGQDLAVAALAALPESVRRQLRLETHGRALFPDFVDRLRADAAALPEVTVGGELDPDAYRATLLACDAVLISSRDDTLPLVSLDALGAARVLMCTPTTGTSAALAPGTSGFVAPEATAVGIAAMLAEAVARRRDWPAIGEAGRAVFASAYSRDAFERRLRDALAMLAPGPRVGEGAA